MNGGFGFQRSRTNAIAKRQVRTESAAALAGEQSAAFDGRYTGRTCDGLEEFGRRRARCGLCRNVRFVLVSKSRPTVGGSADDEFDGVSRASARMPGARADGRSPGSG